MSQGQERFTNDAGLDLGIAVWLAADEYKYDDRPYAISATKLIKPVRQLILGHRVPVEKRSTDLLDRLKSQIGHVLHGGIENAWKHHHVAAMQRLGIPRRVIDAVRINPEQEEPDTIPVYTEFRAEREIGGFVVTGQIDLIIEWRLRDAKSTTVWGYMNQKSVDTWVLQGSIYRWLNPEKIKHDELLIQYLLLDWSAALAKRTPGYPPNPAPTRALALMGLRETERWILERLELLHNLAGAPEKDLPECTEEELWRSEPIYKYYAKEDATGRSTKNFEGPNAEAEARQFMSEKGGKGRIDYVPGKVKACLYCPGFDICSQKDRYLADGTLDTEK